MKTDIILRMCLLSGAGWASGLVLKPRNSHWAVGQTVHTSSGPVIGSSGSIVADVSSYLGIPFAKPPVGDLRFAPPQEYKGHTKINATKFGPSCLISSNFGPLGTSTPPASANLTILGSYLPYSLAQLGDTFSEDCLTLNIWTKPQIGEAKKAVMVWIYGGGFTSGSSSNPGYDGQHITNDEDVIVVSFNYRTTIFGFPGDPHIANNLGLLDQRLAIEWIHCNIASFGGDPFRITIFGQSAGAASVDFYTYAWTDNPIVAGLISESGTTALGGFPKNYSANSWYNVTSSLGCGSDFTDPELVLKCMRSRNATDITAAIPLETIAGGSSFFWPTIDEKVIFSDYPARSVAGNFIKVPLLIGNNDYEAGFFAAMAAISGISQPRSFWEVYSDQGFTCPASARANFSVKAGLPTWRYRYFGDWPDLRLTTVPDSGAYHASELSLLFGILPPEGNGIPAATEQEIAFGKYMRGAWAAFAKDPQSGLRGYGWPLYQPGKKTLVRLAYENMTGTNAAIPALYDSNCQTTFPIRTKL